MHVPSNDPPAPEAGTSQAEVRFVIRGPVTLADYTALQKSLRPHGVVMLWGAAAPLGFGFVGAILGLLTWMAPLWFGGRPGDDTIGWFTGGGFLAAGVAAHLAWKRVVSAYYFGLPYARGHQALVVDAEGIDEETGHVRTRVPWQAIERAVETRAHVFLYFARYVAFIVPKASLAGTGEAERFLAFVSAQLPGDKVVETLR